MGQGWEARSPGFVSSSTAYLLPDLLSDVIKLLGQCVYLQGHFELLLVSEQVAMETVPPEGEGVRLSLGWTLSPSPSPTASGSGTGLLLSCCCRCLMVLSCSVS